MLKQIIDISRNITAITVAILIVFSSSYNSSIVILEPQSAAFKVCKNRLAIVLNQETPTSAPSKTDNTTKTDFGNTISSSCSSLFLSFGKTIEATKFKEPSRISTFLQPIALTGFISEILRPPQF